ncbi:uncharacterized protein [Miscanthus floridulus]|uniref:uncharacterized protein n=1 Tax=Miscanthus floridulus TaxID=154761 RepID=UPI00345810C9
MASLLRLPSPLSPSKPLLRAPASAAAGEAIRLRVQGPSKAKCLPDVASIAITSTEEPPGATPAASSLKEAGIAAARGQVHRARGHPSAALEEEGPTISFSCHPLQIHWMRGSGNCTALTERPAASLPWLLPSSGNPAAAACTTTFLPIVIMDSRGMQVLHHLPWYKSLAPKQPYLWDRGSICEVKSKVS